MSSILCVRERLAVAGLTMLFALAVAAQNAFVPSGTEYAPVGALNGDQVNPAAALNNAGGYLVWEDNGTDGDGTAIVAQKLGPGMAGIYGAFRVNQQGARDQQRPQVALLKNGGAVIVWQGNQTGNWDVYATFVASNGTFVTSDLRVNTFTNADQITPVVACLADGKVVVAWGSFDQDGSYQGVYARRYAADGSPLADEFRVNTSTVLNQRTPSIAPLAAGNFVIAWVSEHLTVGETVRTGIYGQLFNAEGQPIGAEVALSGTSGVCANPALAPLENGGYLAVWSQKSATDKFADYYAPANSWDVFGLTFQSLGKPVQPVPFRVNTFTYGDQYIPRVATVGNDALVVWTSLAQDTSREGVFAQYLTSAGSLVGGEFRVNATTLNQQLQPVVAGDGHDNFLVAWTSYVNLQSSFDLKAQRFDMQQAPLAAPAPPYVTALSQSRLSVTWPLLEGLPVTAYEVYLDSATTPALVSSNSWTAINLAPGSAHTVKLAYRLSDGRTSPLSVAASGATWASDENFDGLPDDWQALYFGANAAAWPAASLDSDGDGVSNLQEFLAGTNPKDAASVLKMSIGSTAQGTRLTWNTQPGLLYQVQVASDLGVWSNLGAPRLAPTNTDSIPITGPVSGAFYRILRIR